MRLPPTFVFAPVVLATLFACSGGDGQQSSATSPTGPVAPLPPQSGPAPLASCGTNLTPFSVSPVAMADILGWVPLGNLGPPGHLFPTDHQYLYVNNPDVPATVRPVETLGLADSPSTSSLRWLPRGVAPVPVEAPALADGSNPPAFVTSPYGFAAICSDPT